MCMNVCVVNSEMKIKQYLRLTAPGYLFYFILFSFFVNISYKILIIGSFHLGLTLSKFFSVFFFRLRSRMLDFCLSNDKIEKKLFQNIILFGCVCMRVNYL